MNRDALDKILERGILGVVLAILVFAPLAMGAVDEWAFLVVQALTAVVMVLWGVRVWAGARPQLLWPPVCWAVVAFTVYAIARYLTADIEYVARLELLQVLVCAFLFLAIINNLNRQEFPQVVSFAMIVLAAGISGYAMFQFAAHSYRVWNIISPYYGRASGTYISPNNLAGFLEIILPLAVAYVLAGRIKAVPRIFIAYAALMLGGGLVVTFSRGGWAAAGLAVLGLVLVLVAYRHHRLPALLFLAITLAAGAVCTKHYLPQTLTYIQRIKQPVESGGVELDLRRDMWHAAEQMWHDHFWFGVGPAHYDYRFRQYRAERVQERPDRAHNDYLNLLADWGAVGGLIVLAGIVLFVVGLVQTRPYVQRNESLGSSGLSNRFAFFLGASAGLFALTVHSFVDFNLHIPANAILGVTLFAVLAGYRRFATERYWITVRTPMKVAITVVLAAGIGYLGWQECRLGRETVCLARATAPGLSLLDHAALLEKAFAAEPKDFAIAYDIGEAYRMQSFEGGTNYLAEAETAIGWYKRAKQLDRFDGYNDLRIGMCLDWTDRGGEAGKYFDAADVLDPNGYFTAANIGWHYFQSGDYSGAREWLNRSVQLKWQNNIIARSYLELVERRLFERAAGKGQFPGFPRGN